MIVPRGIGVARSGCVYPARTRTPTGRRRGRARDATLRLGDLFRDLGPAARRRTALALVPLRVAGARVRRAASAFAGPADAIPLTPGAQIVRRARRRTSRRTRSSSSREGVRRDPPRLLALWLGARRARCSPAAAAARPARASRRSSAARRLLSSPTSRRRRRPAGQADEGLVRDPPAGRAAAHALQARPGPAHGRPPDPRPRRPRARSSTSTRRSRPTGRSARRSRSPRPGRYRIVVDVYPATGQQPNFQLFRHGARRRQADAAAAARRRRGVVECGGYRFAIEGAPKLKAIQATVAHHRRHRPAGQAGDVHAVLRRARARDLLPARARSTTSTRTSARPARPAARASSAARRSPARRRSRAGYGRRARPGARARGACSSRPRSAAAW